METLIAALMVAFAVLLVTGLVVDVVLSVRRHRAGGAR